MLSEEGMLLYKNDVWYNATFQLSFDDKGIEAELSYIGANNGGDVSKYSVLCEKAKKSLEEIGAAVPEDYLITVTPFVHFVEGKAEMSVAFQFSETEFNLTETGDNTSTYEVCFDKVDLSQNTGRVTDLFASVTVDVPIGSYDESERPNFDEAQKNEIIEMARRFFADKGITAGPLRTGGGRVGFSSVAFPAGKKGMTIMFEQMPENESQRTYMKISITSDGEVLGYQY